MWVQHSYYYSYESLKDICSEHRYSFKRIILCVFLSINDEVFFLLRTFEMTPNHMSVAFIFWQIIPITQNHRKNERVWRLNLTNHNEQGFFFSNKEQKRSFETAPLNKCRLFCKISFIYNWVKHKWLWILAFQTLWMLWPKGMTK